MLLTVLACRPVVITTPEDVFEFRGNLQRTEDSAFQSVLSHAEPETLPAILCEYKERLLPKRERMMLPVDGAFEGFSALGPMARSKDIAALWLPI